MIRSALRSLSYLVEDMVSVVKWAVGEAIAEIDYRLVQLDHRLQPEHVRQGWAAELADIEAGIDVHEPNAPYLQWGGPETWPQNPYCNRCGYPHPTTQKCLRDATAEDWVRGTAEACGVDPERCVSRLSFEDAESSAVPPTAERPSEVSAAPPSQTPSEGHPLFTTSLLLEQGAVYAEVLAAMEKDEEVAKWHRIDAAAMRERADAFKAIENTT
jgi:hypothetical protein